MSYRPKYPTRVQSLQSKPTRYLWKVYQHERRVFSKRWTALHANHPGCQLHLDYVQRLWTTLARRNYRMSEI